MAQETFTHTEAFLSSKHAARRIGRATSPLRLAGHAALGFVAFSIGAALRHYITGEIPASTAGAAITLWGWPFGLPLYLAAAYIARPLP